MRAAGAMLGRGSPRHRARRAGGRLCIVRPLWAPHWPSFADCPPVVGAVVPFISVAIHALSARRSRHRACRLRSAHHCGPCVGGRSAVVHASCAPLYPPTLAAVAVALAIVDAPTVVDVLSAP